MFCRNCGQQLADEAKFCEKCGTSTAQEQIIDEATPVAEDQIVEEVSPAAENQIVEESSPAAEEIPASEGYQPEYAAVEMSAAPAGVFKEVPAIIAVAAVAIFVIILAVSGVFKHGSEKALDKYFKSIVKEDAKAYAELTADPYRLEELIDNDVYDDEEDYIDDCADYVESIHENLEDEYGDDFKIDYEIRKVTKYDKDEIEDLDEYLSDERDYPSGVLKDVRVLKVRVSIEGEDDDDKNTNEVVLTKIDNKWYFDSVFYSEDQIENILDEY